MRDHVVLYLNGQPIEASGEEVSLTLAQFLRERHGLVGTKVVCNEGDCGACSVLVGRLSDDGMSLQYQTIDSCIAFLFQLDRTHVVTVEGLRRDSALTPVQEAMVACHGSQCGFCTPGFVVAMHGMIESGEELDEDSLRYGLSGNLCRCTGYAQILEAGGAVDRARVKLVSELYPESEMLGRLLEIADDAVETTGQNTVFIPRTLEQAVDWKSRHPAGIVVSGATDYGVVFNHGRAPSGNILALSNLQEYDNVTVNEQTLRIGGGATWSQIEHHVKDLFPAYHYVITRFGSPQIRNAGTLAGNLANGSPIGDSIPFHLVMDSKLQLVSAKGDRWLPLNGFYTDYRKNQLADDELIGAIDTPLLNSDEQLAMFKISKRRDMDISTMTLAIWVRLENETISDCRIALGGVGPIVQRAIESEQHLIGERLVESAFREAGRIAQQQISPWTDVRGSAEYRLQLTENLMAKAFYQFTGESLFVL